MNRNIGLTEVVRFYIGALFDDAKAELRRMLDAFEALPDIER